MKIIEKNEGTKIDYKQAKYKVSFDDDSLTVNCSKYQKDWDVHIDICMDADKNLVIGTGSGLVYVAQLDIPAKQYEIPEVEEGAEVTEDESPVEIPLDMNDVTLTLWALV
jgi:hypothetical protein